MSVDAIRSLIRDVPDFPEPGIVFKDITPLLADRHGLRLALDALAEPHRMLEVDVVLGIEARGFLFSVPVADRLGVGTVPVRKPGKLPSATVEHRYDLEYGSDTLVIHADAVDAGARVLIVDDVLATGGTAAAAAELVERVGGVVAGMAFLLELGFLDGRAKLDGHQVTSVVRY